MPPTCVYQHSSKETEKRIAAKYAHHLAQVLQALGMSVAQFNNLGRQISEDSQLKEKVGLDYIHIHV